MFLVVSKRSVGPMFPASTTISKPPTMIGVPALTNALGRSPSNNMPRLKATSGWMEDIGADLEAPIIFMAVLCKTRAKG